MKYVDWTSHKLDSPDSWVFGKCSIPWDGVTNPVCTRIQEGRCQASSQSPSSSSYAGLQARKDGASVEVVFFVHTLTHRSSLVSVLMRLRSSDGLETHTSIHMLLPSPKRSVLQATISFWSWAFFTPGHSGRTRVQKTWSLWPTVDACASSGWATEARLS